LNDAANVAATKGVGICKRGLHFEKFMTDTTEKLTWTIAALDRQLVGGREYADTRVVEHQPK